MKTNLLPIVAASVVAALCAGCFTMDSATTETLRHSHHTGMEGRPREHVVVANYGWYLFNVVPLVCGNAREGARFPWVFFRDEVTTDVVHNRLTSYAARNGCHLAELNLYVNDSVLFEVPGTSVPIPMPYVLCYRERLVSALLMDPPLPPPLPANGNSPAPASDNSAAPANDNSAVPTSDNSVAPASDNSATSATSSEEKRNLRKLLEAIPDGGVK